MSYSVERLINLIINDTNKCKTYENNHCGICNKIVKTDQQAIQCDAFKLWVHIGCNDTSLSEYEQLMYESDLWYCLVCDMKNNLDRMDAFHPM